MSLNVIVAPPGPAAGVLDALQDLSGWGLVTSFLWVTAGDVVGGEIRAGDVPAVEVHAGERRGVTLQEALVTGQHGRVRLCVVVPLFGPHQVASEVEQGLATLIQESAAGARLDRIRCALTGPDRGGERAELGQEGWHNLLVAPEDAPGPARHRRLLPPSDDPLDVGRHHAPVVAGILGLWEGLPDAGPLDDETPLPGRTVRQVRSFYRRLDGGAVAGEVVHQVLDMSAGMPLPREHGQPAVPVEDVLLATRTMAEALWAKHAWVLRGSRVPVTQETATSIGAWRALRMLFSFLGAALRNAPGQWYAAVMNSAASSLASSVHSVVFGTAPTAYEIVVRGVTPSGLPAGWEDVAAAAQQLDDALLPPGEAREHEPAARLGPVWRDYAAAAMTLVDGGSRDPALPPVQVGAARGVLRRCSDSVPSRAQGFDEMSGYIAAVVGTESVSPVDVLAVHALRGRLDDLTKDQATALEAERARQALTQWQKRRAQCFGVQVGSVLGRSVIDLTKEIRGLLVEISSLARAVEPDAASQARQRTLARWMKTVLVVAVVLLVAVGALYVLDVLAGDTAAITAASVLLTWFVVSLVLFLNQQRELFRELSRRRAAGSAMEATRQNLRTALRDHRRVTQAYRQFLTWSTVLGAFLERPFGGTADPGTRTGHEAVAGLPLSTAVGVLVADEAVVAEAAAFLRRDMFATGWMSQPFEAMLRGAPALLGPEAHDLTADPDQLFSLDATPESLLSRWAALVAADGREGRSVAHLWGRMQETLEGPARPLADRLLAHVRPSDGERVLSRTDFLAGVDSSASEAPRGSFDSAVLTQEARARDGGSVEKAWGAVEPDGLGLVAVLTQLGPGRSVHDFVAAARTPAAPATSTTTAKPWSPDLSDDWK